MNRIDSFDEYCRALGAEGEVGERARLIFALRSWLVSLQSIGFGSEDELDCVGLTEILRLDLIEPCDEIGRIARETLEPMRHIASHLREKILRENVMLPIGSARELDGAGLNRLSRRSGRTIREKLSSTGRMIGVRRRMSFDTEENRLFMSFVRRLEACIERKRAAKPELVSNAELEFQERALKLFHDAALGEIGRRESAAPNEVLLSDRFYRRIWRARLELQRVSELIAADDARLDERLCTVCFWKLLRAAGAYCRFPQQPIECDYARFELAPLNGRAIFGHNPRGVFKSIKDADRISIEYGGSSSELVFDNATLVLKSAADIRERITADNLDALIERTVGIVFGDETPLSEVDDSPGAFGNEVFVDLFSTRPMYLSAGVADRFRARFVRSEFRARGKRYDLSTGYSDALSFSDESELYSIASCLHAPTDERERLGNLFRMLHDHFDAAAPKIDRLSIPFPDVCNEFQLSELRRAARVCFDRLQTMPRSIAMMFSEAEQERSALFRDGEFALVVDYVRGRISMTLVQMKFDRTLARALPETHGVTWERHPTFVEQCGAVGYESFDEKLDELLIRSGFNLSSEVLEKVLNVFGAKGLTLEAERLTLERDGEWLDLTQKLLKVLPQTQFVANDAIERYLSRMKRVIGGKKVFVYIISPQLKFLGNGAAIKTDDALPLRGMRFYSELRRRADAHETQTGESLPPLWRDRLPALSLKRLFGSFELIGDKDVKKISPLFGVEQTIPIERRFTLPRGRKEYRFDLILGESKEIFYEAVVRHRAFPLSTDAECELRLTYAYGRDIPYDLTLKPAQPREFREARVEFEARAEHRYKELPSPNFPLDNETWQTLQHIPLPEVGELDALDFIERTFETRRLIDFDRVEYSTDELNGFVFVRMPIDDLSTIIRIEKKKLGVTSNAVKIKGTYSCVLVEDRTQRFETTFGANDWNGRTICFKHVMAHAHVAFHEDRLLFGARARDTGGRRVSFDMRVRASDDKVIVSNMLIEDRNYRRYRAENVVRGSLPYYLKTMAVMFPLHKVYADGRSSSAPDCPPHFRECVARLADEMPEKFVAARCVNALDLSRKLLKIMCVMSADIKKVYEQLATILAQRPSLADEDLGCALGDCTRPEQRQLLKQILSSKMSEPNKMFALGKAAWKTEGFVVNAPTDVLMRYFDYALELAIDRANHKPREVLLALEYVTAIFRLRSRRDDELSRRLSLNNEKLRRFYAALEEMVEEKYELPRSRIELEVHRSEEYVSLGMNDLIYALMVYVTGVEDEIKLVGINEDDDV